MSPKESFFIQAVRKIKAGKLAEAEKDLKALVKKRSQKSEKAEILLAVFQIRRECDKLLKRIK